MSSQERTDVWTEWRDAGLKDGLTGRQQLHNERMNHIRAAIRSQRNKQKTHLHLNFSRVVSQNSLQHFLHFFLPPTFPKREIYRRSLLVTLITRILDSANKVAVTSTWPPPHSAQTEGSSRGQAVLLGRNWLLRKHRHTSAINTCAENVGLYSHYKWLSFVPLYMRRLRKDYLQESEC